jgi:hypothetical protein
MEKIKLSDILGYRVKKVYSGSELLFIYEINKYTKEMLGKELDLEDLQMVKELRRSEYFSYVYSKGMSFNYMPVDSELVDITEVSRKFFNSDLSGVVFATQTDKEWVYNYRTDTRANLVLNQYNRSAGYVSLFAYMLVTYYKLGKKLPMLVLENTSPKQEEMEYVDILILQNFGNEYLKGKVKIIFSKDVVIQPEWEAYIIYHRQLGYMNAEVKAVDKFKYILKNYDIGDVVLFYETDKAIKSKTIRRLMNCHPGVITGITRNYVRVTYYPDVQTLLTTKRVLQNAEEVCGGDFKYSPEDYSRFIVCDIKLDYFDMGVDTLFYTEDKYLLHPLNGTDTFKQHLIDKNGVEGIYEMDTLNTIYAVFEDRKVKYNKERFLTKYFKKEKPIYDVVLGR